MHTFHSNEPPKVLSEVENSEYLTFLSLFFKAKTEKCNRTNLSVSNKFEMVIPRSATYYLELRAHASLKVANKSSFRGKKLWKFSIFKLLFKSKIRMSATKKTWSVFNKFEILMPGSDTYFLGVTAHVSLKVSTKGSFSS